jgi:uncharacterized membrane protein
MDEATLHAIQSAITWLTVGVVAVVVALVILLVLVGWIASTVNYLKGGLKKLFDWFDERPCAKHQVEIEGMKERLTRLEK